jgi:hypothetical protein
LLGLDLAENFDNSYNCIDELIAYNDDRVQFWNNVTFETMYTAPEDRRFIYPAMNFTKMIFEHVSFVPVYCYQFVFVEVYKYWLKLYLDMENDFNFLLISFLFTQMGNAPKFKNAIDQIQLNSETQEYVLVFN